MNGNLHFVFAGACTSMVALNLDKITALGLNIEANAATATLIIMGGLIGGIFPDIDNPKSHMGQLSKPVSTIIGKISGFIGKKGCMHRGICHDFSLYLAGLIWSYFCFPPMMGFFLGALSHLLLDAFNPMGVPVLFGASTLHLGRIYAGSKAASLFVWAATFFVIGIGVAVHTGLCEGII